MSHSIDALNLIDERTDQALGLLRGISLALYSDDGEPAPHIINMMISSAITILKDARTGLDQLQVIDG